MKHHSSIARHHKLAAAAIAVAWLALPLPVLAQYHHGPPPQHHEHYDHHDYHGHYDNHYDYHHDHYDHYDHYDNGGAVVAGALLGVAAGVAISSANTPQPPPTVVYTSPPPPPPPGVVYYNDGY